MHHLALAGFAVRCFVLPMKVITDLRCTEYHSPGHPERPQRIQRSHELLKSQTELPIDWLDPLPVSDEQILRAHSKRLLEAVDAETDFGSDTPSYPGIAQHTRRSVGSALHALKLCRAGELAFSLMRPPGHHATRDEAMGFCYFNSIAIAALESHAIGTKKVAIFDFDVHHGNGTEDILLNQDGFAFFSVHQHPAYPGSGGSHRGNNCFNFPVAPDSPAYAYRDACSAAMAKMKEFKPDLIAISAGFDSHRTDLLCQQNMETEDFHWLGEQVQKLKTPTFTVLEGGYSKALPDAILSYLKGWAGQKA